MGALLGDKVKTFEIERELENLNFEDLTELTWSIVKPYYKMRPVRIQKFIEDPYFLGDYFKDDFSFYPFWMDKLKLYYPTEFHSPYYELIWDLPIGSGKTLTATVIILYEIYKLMCIRNPWEFYVLAEGTRFVFSIFSARMKTTSDVNWEYFDKLLTKSPFFLENCPLPKGGKQVSYDTVVFPGNIAIDLGSQSGHALGKAIFGAMLDEANFQRVPSGQAKESYLQLKRRRDSRFLQVGGTVPGKLMLISSPKLSTDFLEEQKKASRGTSSTHIIENVPIWEIVKGTAKDIYCGDTFKLFIGSKTEDPYIVEPGKKEPFDPSRVVNVPVEHRKSFSEDIISSLRDIYGLSVSKACGFITSPEKLNAACMMPLRTKKEIISLDFYDSNDKLSDYLDMNYFSKLPFPESYRFIHLDLAKSNDRAALASTFVRTDEEILGRQTLKSGVEKKNIMLYDRSYYTELLIYLEAKSGQEIPIFKLRDIIFFLKKIGYPIFRVSADQYQSVSLLQEIEINGIKTENISVDKTRAPYVAVKQLIYKGNLLMPNSSILKEEFLGLVDDTVKIDHTINGSKDGSDAVTGSVFNAITSDIVFKQIANMGNIRKNAVDSKIENIFDKANPSRLEEIFNKTYGNRFF